MLTETAAEAPETTLWAALLPLNPPRCAPSDWGSLPGSACATDLTRYLWAAFLTRRAP